ncbi:AAA family ATPase [Mesorhizobium sp. AR10]|uniref:ATP-dependent nuclease n=1 Tax=Mesorhizobium sp. AR10 TaxID=2865839 RepID=UPI00215E717C|nr:AAA family ATPase [Mesorhizobium sp. AR10]UVK36836.1 AAA family ATPase [Mesorhizobium sp. AR10]
MPIDFKLSKVVIDCFRGIEHLELDLRDGFPSVLIGSNNAGKSTVLNAIALALNGGGYHQWSPEPTDFFCDASGKPSNEFTVQVHFHSDNELGYPAVKGVAKPSMIHGVQVKGRTAKGGKLSHSRTLFDGEGNSVTTAPRTSLSADDKKKYADHDIGYKLVNARLDDIHEHTPEVWFFKPQNIEASLYVWKSGPIAKLSKLLATRFLIDDWVMKVGDGGERKMPGTLHKAYDFFRQAVEAFPFWSDDMKPRLERVFSRYVGSHAKIDLQPNTQLLEEWLAQQLAVSLATDPDSVTTPLKSMGDGWQSVIRLAALEALSEYPELLKERVVLLLEEPETHLHPHLRRKIRKVLGALALKGWTVVYTTHSPELVSFDQDQVITRLVRTKGSVTSKSLQTDKLEQSAKLQSKLDDRGAHDFLFGTAAVFCEGKDDQFAVKLAFEQLGVDIDARSVSVTQCEGVSSIPAFASISRSLGIRWCALTDEDILKDGTVKPKTEKARAAIERCRTVSDLQAMWPVDLEQSLGVTEGKATPEITTVLLGSTAWQTDHPHFKSVIASLAAWIDPSVRV